MSETPIVEASLVLGDRINYPFILATGILKYYDAVIRDEGSLSPQQVQEAAKALFGSIPDAWRVEDKTLESDLKKATRTIKVDKRKLFCGQKYGAENWEIREEYDPYELFHATINLMQRRGYLSKTMFTEKMVPDPDDFKELEEEVKEVKEG